ncbi:hypothetical protein ACFL4G_10090 [Thermodesulfobacteriota bacterium]
MSMKGVRESDWKKLRDMKGDVLHFACERIFAKIEDVMRERKGKEHEAYRKLWRLLKEEDREIAIMFDDLKRSNAIRKLAAWKHNGVISDEDFSAFSDETQQSANALVEIFH